MVSHGAIPPSRRRPRAARGEGTPHPRPAGAGARDARLDQVGDYITAGTGPAITPLPPRTQKGRRALSPQRGARRRPRGRHRARLPPPPPRSLAPRPRARPSRRLSPPPAPPPLLPRRGRCPHPRRPLLRDASRRGVRVDVGCAGPWGSECARARATAAAGGRGRRRAGRGLPARPPRRRVARTHSRARAPHPTPARQPPPRAAPLLAARGGVGGRRGRAPPAPLLHPAHPPHPPLIVSPPNASPNEKITEPPGDGGGGREGSLTHLPWSSPPVV